MKTYSYTLTCFLSSVAVEMVRSRWHFAKVQFVWSNFSGTFSFPIIKENGEKKKKNNYLVWGIGCFLFREEAWPRSEVLDSTTPAQQDQPCAGQQGVFKAQLFIDNVLLFPKSLQS